jgi:hypothetical protein
VTFKELVFTTIRNGLKKGMKTVNSSSSESIEVEALLATSVLDADNIPNKNQSETCFSCGSKMVGLYCKDCGQKNDDFRRSIFSLIIEAFTSFFSLESRMWRTWLYLIIKPGRPAREFADGKRTIWTSPVRIYLAMSIILFGYMSLTDTRLISVRSDVSPRDGIIGDVGELADTQVKLSPQLLFFARQKTLDELNEDVDFDQVERLISGVPRARFYLDDEDTPDTGEAALPTTENDAETFASELIDDIMKSEAAEELIEVLEENSVVRGENGEPITDPEARREALERALGQSESYIGRLNQILSYYIDPQSVAQKLHEGEIPLTAHSLIESLPDNLTEEKRDELVTQAEQVIQDLTSIGITSENISQLELRLSERGALLFGNMNLNGRKISSDDTKRGAMRILKQPEILNEAFAIYLPRIMFFMMPFAMFLGILFVRGRKNALMYDHLVHAAYIHAFTYMYLLFLIVLSQWTNVSGLWSAFLWGMVIYLPISARNMFKRGWIKTIWMTFNIAFAYSITIFIIMTYLLASQLDKAVSAI